MRCLVLLLSVFALTGSVRAGQRGEADFEKLFVRALELHQAGDLLGAVDNYKAALGLSPDRADALSNLGAAYAQLGQFDDAVTQYQAALKADPLNSAVRLNLALAYYKSARPQAAIPQLKRVLASQPEAKSAYLVLADCYLQTGQAKEVVSLLQPREQMFGADLAFAYVLGTALLDLERTDEGQAYVDRIFGAGESAEARLLMGTALMNRKQFREARIELQRAIKLNPRLPTVHSLYGRTVLALGDYQAAEAAFRKELELNVNDFQANIQMGSLRSRTQRFAEATGYVERAVTIRPEDFAARRLLAHLRLQTGRAEEAAALFEALVKETPDAVDLHVQLAIAYNRLKRTADAQREREIVDKLNAAEAAKQKGGL